MTTLVTLLLTLQTSTAGAKPVHVRVDGDGYLRFIRDGRVLYARSASLKSVHGYLGTTSGGSDAIILPKIAVPDSGDFAIDLMGNVTSIGQAGTHHPLGRLVLALPCTQNTPSTIEGVSPDEGFVTFADRPALGNPGDDSDGVVRTDGTGNTSRGSETDSSAVVAAVPKHTTPAHESQPVVRSTTASPQPKVKPTNSDKNNSGALEIIIRPHTDVTHDTYTLGELADITGPEANVEKVKALNLGVSPIPGFARAVDGKYVALRLLGLGFRPSSYTLVIADGTDIARKSVTISSDDLLAKAIEAVQASVGAKLTLTTENPIKPVTGKDGDIAIESSHPLASGKGFLVVLTVRQGDSIIATRSVTLTPSGDIASVKSGDAVTVVIKSGAATVEVPGKTSSAGYLGQQIQVTISGVGAKPTSHTGTLVAAGKVEVNL